MKFSPSPKTFTQSYYGFFKIFTVLMVSISEIKCNQYSEFPIKIKSSIKATCNTDKFNPQIKLGMQTYVNSSNFLQVLKITHRHVGKHIT